MCYTSMHHMYVFIKCMFILSKERILHIMPDFFFFIQTLLKVLYFLAQHVVHLQLLLHDILQLLHVRIHIENNIAHSLHLGYQLTLLRQQLSVLFDSSHVSSEYLLLLLENIAYFLGKSHVLLTHIIVFESCLHDVDVFLHFSFILVYLMELLLYVLLHLSLFLKTVLATILRVFSLLPSTTVNHR